MATALIAVAGLAGTVAAGCSDGAGAAPDITTTAQAGVAPVPPDEGAYFGAWLPGAAATGGEGDGGADDGPSARPSGTGSGTDGPDGPDLADVTAFEGDLGRRLDIVQTYHGWKADFPGDLAAEVTRSDRSLLLTWNGGDTREIVQGRFDDMVRERARAIKKLGKPVFLRWSRDMDELAEEERVHSPADFIAAWKHMRKVFAEEKVQNVAWVWCPTARGFGTRDAGAYYPGDAHVDWICADVRPSGDFDFQALSESLKPFLEWARDRSKPIMIAEFGVPRSYGERRAEWLRAAAETLQDPQVKAVVYFNSDERADGPRDERNRYAVTGDEHAVSALRELATAPYFNPRDLPVTSGG
ncbi:glycoside hydrolase family 26 protein [Actinomadura sp. WAC 06369]|uniref:glycoside hydrolase family 26 protein n=1 Tax=Actinomadura sp. WAC 06369 TaxID=2203193 RepID=UPI001F40688F|nr:hypothetical protein [Actinomadura sp. WAC 06369]